MQEALKIIFLFIFNKHAILFKTKLTTMDRLPSFIGIITKMRLTNMWLVIKRKFNYFLYFLSFSFVSINVLIYEI